MRLRHLYFSLEKPLPPDISIIARECRLDLTRGAGITAKNAVKVLSSLLHERFVLGADGWHHLDWDKQITEQLQGKRKKSEDGKRAVNKRWRNRESNTGSNTDVLPLNNDGSSDELQSNTQYPVSNLKESFNPLEYPREEPKTNDRPTPAPDFSDISWDPLRRMVELIYSIRTDGKPISHYEQGFLKEYITEQGEDRVREAIQLCGDKGWQAKPQQIKEKLAETGNAEEGSVEVTLW